MNFIPINQLHINNDIQHIKFCTCVEKFAVGISTTENTVHKENWHTEIEKLSQSSDLNYSRERYYETCNEVMIADERIEVLGTMGTGY
jgi:hypothetical protein